jgi:hypothetical protein
MPSRQKLGRISQKQAQKEGERLDTSAIESGQDSHRKDQKQLLFYLISREKLFMKVPII